MIVSLHTWSDNDRESLIVLCNAVDRTFLSDRLPYPYTEADADWWLGMVAENEGKEGAWRAIVMDGQIVGSISVERMAEDQRNVGSIGYMILTPFWSQGIGTEAVRQICGIAFQELALERIIGEVFPENLASARVLEKNGFQLEETVYQFVFIAITQTPTVMDDCRGFACVEGEVGNQLCSRVLIINQL